MANVVITGASSAIGIALIKRFLKEDAYILAFVSRNSKNRNRIPEDEHITVIECGIDEYESFITECDKYDYFYHLAWEGTGKEKRNDLILQTTNIQGSIYAVLLARRLGCKRYIGIGSQAEYGLVKGKMTEDTFINPVTGYGMAKLCAGIMTSIECEKNNIEYIWARLFSVYGPYIGLDSVLNYAMMEVMAGKSPILSEARQKWDYLYVDDAAEALYLLAIKGHSGEIYNIGSGDDRTLREYLMEAGAIVDNKVELRFGGLFVDKLKTYGISCDNSKLINHTGFQIQYSFRDGIMKTLEWIKSEVNISELLK